MADLGDAGGLSWSVGEDQVPRPPEGLVEEPSPSEDVVAEGHQHLFAGEAEPAVVFRQGLGLVTEVLLGRYSGIQPMRGLGVRCMRLAPSGGLGFSLR